MKNLPHLSGQCHEVKKAPFGKRYPRWGNVRKPDKGGAASGEELSPDTCVGD